MTTVSPPQNDNRNDGRSARELIAFRIGEQEFCVDIMSVREIRGWTPATPLPHAPSYVRGVINLRGAVLPIVDLAARLGLRRARCRRLAASSSSSGSRCSSSAFWSMRCPTS